MNPYKKELKEKDDEIYRLRKMVDRLFVDPKAITKTEEKIVMPYIKEGTLFQRKDKRWEAYLYIDGKQTSVACCKRQEDALKKLKAAIEEKNKVKKANQRQQPFTLHSWLDHWFKVFREPKMNNGLAPATLKNDKTHIRKIKKVLKDIKLKDLTADYIQTGLNGMKELRSRESIHSTLTLALDKALDRLPFNPMSMVEKAKSARNQGRALSKEEVEQILAATKNQDEFDVFNFYLYTGCRPDELTSTKVGFINFTNKIEVMKNLVLHGKQLRDMQVLPNEIFIDGTKNFSSKRAMPIMPQIQAMLERRAEGKLPGDKLFPFAYWEIKNIKERIQVATGIHFTIKDFRHTCSTNFKDAGIPLEVYYRWLGWSSESMARKVYNHDTDVDYKLAQDWAGRFGADQKNVTYLPNCRAN